MKESWTETLGNEEAKGRCGMVDILQRIKARETRVRWYMWIISRHEEKSWCEAIESEEIRRSCGMVDVAQKVKRAVVVRAHD
jgi:hypothetical protein